MTTRTALINPLSQEIQGFIVKAVLLALTILSSTAQAASPFTTEGKLSVGSDGSANYSIPIVVPPGTAGMQPQLALNYNSNGGNGIVGMGWGIDGLSQISRCGSTLEQDGVINGVTYTNTDRFCIDGQRLIATSDTYTTSTKQYSTTSAYGANGTEYRTESANFAKVISYGQAGNGPAYFKVWTKSGQIIEYGNTADSAIEAQGKPTIRTWGVNKISDTKGNYITVSYLEDNANGEAYVSRIDYTGNAVSTPALTPYANIQFVYEARPDTTIGYQAGSVLKTTKRLTNIQTFNGTTQVKSYKLAYELSQSTNRSRLKTIQECDSGSATGICKQSISFNFDGGSVGFNTLESYPEFVPNSFFNPSYPGRVMHMDINGDGLEDLVAIGEGKTYLAFGNGSGFGSKVTLNGQLFSDSWFDANYPGRIIVMDANGDGRADIVSIGTGAVEIAFSNGTGFNPKAEYSEFVPNAWFSASNPGRVMHMDVNGDGVQDFVAIGTGVTYVMKANSLAEYITSLSPTSTYSVLLAYKNIKNSSVYTKDITSVYPLQDLQGAGYVVSSATVSDGVGGVVTTNYQYGGLKAHLRGRGSLGFRYVKESSPDSGLSVTTFYRQDFPFIGLPSQVEKRRLSDNALLSVVQNTYANTDLATGTMLSKFPYLSQSVEQAYELDGSLVSTTSTTNQYDGYGNVTSVSVDDGLGNTKTTTSTYNNDVGNWLLGRLIRSTVTSITP